MSKIKKVLIYCGITIGLCLATFILTTVIIQRRANREIEGIERQLQESTDRVGRLESEISNGYRLLDREVGGLTDSLKESREAGQSEIERIQNTIRTLDEERTRMDKEIKSGSD